MRIARLSVFLAALLCASPIAMSAVSDSDLKVAARALSFMENAPVGTIRVGIVFNPGNPQSAADAAAKMAALAERTELVRSVQFELKRVGCLDAPVSGEFGTPARDALNKFAKFAAVTIGSGGEISSDTLSLIRRFDRRVCPLNCRSDEKADGERCVRVVCPAGQIAAKGACVADPNRQATPAPAPERPTSGGSKCFTFNNRRFCE